MSMLYPIIINITRKNDKTYYQDIIKYIPQLGHEHFMKKHSTEKFSGVKLTVEHVCY